MTVPEPGCQDRRSVTRRLHLTGDDGRALHVLATAIEDESGHLVELLTAGATIGRTVRGLLEGCCGSFNAALAHGVPLAELLDRWQRLAFEPAGFTGDKEIPRCSSILDYLQAWLRRRYLEAKP